MVVSWACASGLPAPPTPWSLALSHSARTSSERTASRAADRVRLEMAYVEGKSGSSDTLGVRWEGDRGGRVVGVTRPRIRRETLAAPTEIYSGASRRRGTSVESTFSRERTSVRSECDFRQ